MADTETIKPATPTQRIPNPTGNQIQMNDPATIASADSKIVVPVIEQTLSILLTPFCAMILYRGKMNTNSQTNVHFAAVKFS